MRWMLGMVVAAACAPSPQGPIHAPGPPPEASPTSIAVGGSTPEPRAGWFCYDNRIGPYTMTWCERTLDACSSLREIEMGDAKPGMSWSSCEAHDRAYCYSFRDQKEQGELGLCYVTAAECAHDHDTSIELSAEPDDLHPVPGSVTPCLETR